MDAFQAYTMYCAMKMHFSDSEYNYEKYHGKVKVSQSSFDTKPFKFSFKRLSQKDNPKDLIISNFIFETKWITDLLSEESNLVYIDWKKRVQSLTYHFQEQIELLPDDIDFLLKFNNSDFPHLLELYKTNKVSPETIVILDFVFDFLKVWHKKTKDTIVMTDRIIRLIKYKSFLTYNNAKIVPILVDKFKK